MKHSRLSGSAQGAPGGWRSPGRLQDAVAGAWMVIEAVPEDAGLKTEVFGGLDRLAEADAILASNSSSLPSSQVIGKVGHPERVLNTHYYQPPELNCVELMSCGRTDPGIIGALMARMPRYGLVPFHVRRESDGFIFNRVWAAIKRECLMVVEEGVADPADVDEIWKIFTRPGIPPFRLMDRVGLNVVLAIEEHYASVRPGIPDGPRKLLRSYLEQGGSASRAAGASTKSRTEAEVETSGCACANTARPRTGGLRAGGGVAGRAGMARC